MSKTKEKAEGSAILEPERDLRFKNQRRSVGILTRNFSHAEPVCQQYWHRSVRSWLKNQIIWKQEEIDFLLSLSAPMEVFYQDVDGPAKN
jgi:hypothetical protein